MAFILKGMGITRTKLLPRASHFLESDQHSSVQAKYPGWGKQFLCVLIPYHHNLAYPPKLNTISRWCVPFKAGLRCNLIEERSAYEFGEFVGGGLYGEVSKNFIFDHLHYMTMRYYKPMYLTNSLLLLLPK